MMIGLERLVTLLKQDSDRPKADSHYGEEILKN